jgi:hypothetical protein
MSVGVASVRGNVASGRPASLTWMVVSEFVGVALGTESASPADKHVRVLRAVSVVTLVASAAAKAGYWVVLVDKRTGFICVASYAFALERGLSNLRGFRWMNCMAVAACKLSLRHWMVEIQSEFRELRRMALATKGDLVRLKQ